VTWFFRAIEAETGAWVCRRGRHVIDEHPSLAECIDHLKELASPHGPAACFAHWQDGRVERLAAFE
jgi:NAD-dependent oxidoreductase involved in siderophore biosynthesis